MMKYLGNHMMNGILIFSKNIPAFIFAFIICVVFIGCKEEAIIEEKLDYGKLLGVEIAEDVTMYHSDSALIRANISGPKFYRYTSGSNPHEDFTEGVSVIFFDSRGYEESWLQANFATRLSSKSKVIVDGEVILYNNQGDTLETSQLIWDEKEGKIFTDRFVKLTKPDRIIMGYGFESNQEFSEGHIKAVEGTWDFEIEQGEE